jgi:hypothetical protein
MLYLWSQVVDPLAFIHAQAHWNRQAIFPLQTLWTGIMYVLHRSWSSNITRYARNFMNTITVTAFLGISITQLRQWRPAYLLYAILLFGLTLSSVLPGESIMQSTSRYVMVLFPVYITLARWSRRSVIHWFIIVLWIPSFSLLTACFTRWYFIT